MSIGVYSPAGGIPYYYIRYTKGAIYIQAWASALLVQLDWAMRRPSDVGRVTVWTPTLFSYIINSILIFLYVGSTYIKNMRMAKKTKLILSFIGGIIVGFFLTCLVIGRYNHILTDEEYNQYKLVTTKDNLIEAYRGYYINSMNVFRQIQNTVGLDRLVDVNTLNILNTDVNLIQMEEKHHKEGASDNYSINSSN